MRRRRMVPAPKRATWVDAYRIGLGPLMIPLGITIIARSMVENVVTPPTMLIGRLFVAFGAYRLCAGLVRYRNLGRRHPR